MTEAQKNAPPFWTARSRAEEAVRAGGAILLSLPNSEIVEATLRALPDGAAAEKVFLDLSTSFPLSTKALAEELAQKGAFLLDAPLLAGPDEAKAGTLTAMIGGDRTAFDRVSPLLKNLTMSVHPAARIP